MDGQRGGQSEPGTAREYFPLRPPTFPALFPSPRVKDKPGGAAVRPSDCVRRLAAPHTGTPLITGAGLSLPDTKTPHADSRCIHSQTNKHHGCSCTHARERQENAKRLHRGTHSRFLKTFWQRSVARAEKGMPNSLESHQDGCLELV